MKKMAFLILLVLLPHCGKQESTSEVNTKNDYSLFKKGNIPKPAPYIEPAVKQKSEVSQKQTNNHIPELDFQVENATGKTLFVTCFSYIQKQKFVPWRWDKSPVYKIEPGKSASIDIDTITDTANRDHTFGYLAIFHKEDEAKDSIFELVPDEKKIDLDKLYLLKGKRVVINIEQYGFKKDRLDPQIEDQFKKKAPHPELDFVVENNTGKTVFVTAFIYQIKDDIRSVWNYDKTPVLKLEQGQAGIMDIDTIVEERNREYMLAALGVFAEHQEPLARDVTYELLDAKNKVILGSLRRLTGKKVILEPEQYGKIGAINDFDIQPTESPIQRLREKKEQKPTQKNTQNLITPETQHDVSLSTPKPRKNNGEYQFFS
jgi:hypothetical protein